MHPRWSQVPFDLWIQKSVKLLVYVVLIDHIMLCAYWLTKELFSTPDDMAAFLEIHDIAPEDTVSKYVLAGYFINTVVTTVGFGDVKGNNTAEQLLCIIVMWIGTVVFAIVVSEASDIIAKVGCPRGAACGRWGGAGHADCGAGPPRVLNRRTRGTTRSRRSTRTYGSCSRTPTATRSCRCLIFPSPPSQPFPSPSF